MILDTKNMKLENIQLTEREYRFIAGLCNHELVFYENLYSFIYKSKTDRKTMLRNLKNIRDKINKKVKLNLQTIYNWGYVLDNIIEIV